MCHNFCACPSVLRSVGPLIVFSNNSILLLVISVAACSVNATHNKNLGPTALSGKGKDNYRLLYRAPKCTTTAVNVLMTYKENCSVNRIVYYSGTLVASSVGHLISQRRGTSLLCLNLELLDPL